MRERGGWEEKGLGEGRVCTIYILSVIPPCPTLAPPPPPAPPPPSSDTTIMEECTCDTNSVHI